MYTPQIKTEARVPATSSKPFFAPAQAKLTVNQPNDVYEQEADAVADKVMRMPVHSFNSPSFFSPAAIPVQRKCAHCEEEEKKVQRKELNSSDLSAADPLTEYVGSVNNKGTVLSNQDQQFFESRMGYDFSNVKIHTDSVAAKSAESLNALAYTSGSNIVFNQNQYKPDTDTGKRLLAHELTHVMQQGAGVVAPKLIQKQPDLTATRFSGNRVLENALDGIALISKTNNRSGAHVRLIQEALLALGYTLPRFGADGVFGNETEAAVRLFQVDNGANILDGIVGGETMRTLNMQDTGGTVALAGPSPAAATAAAFSEAATEPFTGYDNSQTPNWLVVPASKRRHADVAVTPAGAIPAYTSDNPGVATVERTADGIAVSGVSAGTANIIAQEGGITLSTLQVSVKNELSRSVAVHYVCDSRAVAAGGPNCSDGSPTADEMRSLLNRVWHLQANIIFTGGAAHNVVVPGDLGAAVDWTSPGGGEWNTVIATGTGANYNIFRVWQLRVDGAAVNNGANLGNNTLLGDNPCADGLGLAHECGHFLGLDHPNGFIMTPCGGRTDRRVSKAMVDLVNP